MKEELYIKGERVDLSDGEITLNFKSNFLGDISKITASNSYTITLPRTSKNIRLLGFPDVAGHESYMMKDYFNAEYYRNGLKLFDAKAVLISCSEDGFNVSLTWGIDDKFISLINENKSIQEFADMALPWNSSTTYDNGLVDGQLSHGYIRHNAGIDVDSNRDKIFVHPSVNCMRLLEEIASYYGIAMEWGSYKQYIELLYLPLISQKASSKYNFFEANITGTLDSDIKYVKFTQINRVDGINISNTETYGDVVRIYETSLDWELDILISTNKHNTLNVVELAFYSNAQYIKSLQISSNDIGLCAYKGVIPFDITEYSNITIRIRINNGALLGIIKSYIKIFSEDVQSVSYNQYYPIGINLPNISVVDFIKQICWLFGLFAIKIDTGVFFMPVSKIIDNKKRRSIGVRS